MSKPPVPRGHSTIFKEQNRLLFSRGVTVPLVPQDCLRRPGGCASRWREAPRRPPESCSVGQPGVWTSFEDRLGGGGWFSLPPDLAPCGSEGWSPCTHLGGTAEDRSTQGGGTTRGGCGEGRSEAHFRAVLGACGRPLLSKPVWVEVTLAKPNHGLQ